jgi:hypothetical protein
VRVLSGERFFSKEQLATVGHMEEYVFEGLCILDKTVLTSHYETRFKRRPG